MIEDQITKFFNQLKRLSFNEETHSYWLDGHQINKLTSVSNFIKQYFEEFDKEKWSKYIARKRKISQAEVLAEWDAKRDNSIILGKSIHSVLENLFKNKIPPTIDTKFNPFLESAYKFYEDIKDWYKNFYTEVTLFSENKGIAGTTDLLALDRGNRFDIFDYKTVEELKISNKYNKFLLKDLNYLEDCSFNKYALQVNLYALMTQELSGFKVKNRFLVHLKPKSYDLYYVSEMGKELSLMFKM